MSNQICAHGSASGRSRFFGKLWIMAVLLLPVSLIAEEFWASTPSEISAALQQVQPGDTITMTNGIWTNAEILFKANGTAGDSILLRAETPGRVLLNGTSRLRIAGSYLIVSGLYFKGGSRPSGSVIEFRENSGNLANHSRLTNTVIVDYNPPNINTDYKWVSLYGVNNRVDHCYFRNKTHSGTTLVVWLSNTPNYHRIDHNYFAFRPELGFNGGETIRIGTSDWSMYDSYTTVEYNYFEECNGETEIISNKSGHNTFRYNTFYDCDGILTLRHGNFAEVYGNFFFGANNTGAGGVRIIGEDHKVYNNYFQDLYGSGYHSPLVFMNGVPNSPLNRYFQVKRALVMFNTFVNCRNTILVGAGKDSELSLPPLDCMIANNVVYTTNSGQIIDYEDTPVNMQYEGNVMFGSPLGIDANPGITAVDPQLVFATDSLWRPDNASPLIDAAVGNYPDVTNDVDGQPRDAAKDIGADEFSAEPILIRPVFGDNTGADWYPLSISVKQVAPGTNALSDAVQLALPGDILELLPGEFPNDGNIAVSVALTIRAADITDRPVIRNTAASATSRAIFEIVDGGKLYLSDLELDGMSGSTTPATHLIRTSDAPMNRNYILKAENCLFRNVNDGSDGSFFYAYPGTFADSIVFNNCLFSDAAGIGISLKDEAIGSSEFNVDWLEFNNCTFWNIAKQAIFVYGGDQVPFTPQPRLRINHVTFDNCGSDGTGIVYAKDCDAAQIKNSIFSNSPADSAAVIIEGLVATISYCDTFNVGPVIANRSAGIGNGMVGIDPQYFDRANGNFMLPNGTPLAGLASDGKVLGDLRWSPQTVGIGDDPDIEPATGFALFQNYPNPFNPETTIGYAIEKPGPVSLNIYAIDGSLVATIVDQFHAPGSYSVRWNAANFASGVYVYQLKIRGKILSRKLLLLK